MNISINSKTKKPLLGREDVQFSAEFDAGIPSRKEVRSALAAALGVADEKLLLVSLKGSYGVHKAEGLARVYESADGLKKDKKHLQVRDGLMPKEEKKKAPAKAPAKK
jgi:ribosomal protein S24E